MVAKGEVILPLLSLGGNLSESRDRLILLLATDTGSARVLLRFLAAIFGGARAVVRTAYRNSKWWADVGSS